MTQAVMFAGKVILKSIIHVMLSHVRRLPSPLSDVLPEVIATDDQIKHTVSLNQIAPSPNFEIWLWNIWLRLHHLWFNAYSSEYLQQQEGVCSNDSGEKQSWWMNTWPSALACLIDVLLYFLDNSGALCHRQDISGLCYTARQTAAVVAFWLALLTGRHKSGLLSENKAFLMCPKTQSHLLSSSRVWIN